MKPLVRWTIFDQAHPRGYQILEFSIQQMQKLYGDKFDYYLLYNSIHDHNKYRIDKFAQKYNLQIIEQRIEDCPICLTKPYTFWKVCPPRLQINTHELLLDNDVVFFEAPIEIEEFLNNSKTLIINDCYNYMGELKGIGPYNSGILGLPPNFDFNAKIQTCWKDLGFKSNSLHPSSEQGLLTYILSKEPHIAASSQRFICLHPRRISEKVFFNTNKPNQELDFFEYTEENIEKLKKCPVVHFILANGDPCHYGWDALKPCSVL